MHDGLRLAGGAARVLPEAHVVRARRLGREPVGRGRDEAREGAGTGRRGPRDDDRAEVAEAVGERAHPGKDAFVDDVRPRSAVGEEIRVVTLGEERRERDRHRSDLDRAEERRDEVGRVREQDRDAVLHIDAEVAKRVPGPVDVPCDLRVAERPSRVPDGGAVAVARRHVRVDQDGPMRYGVVEGLTEGGALRLRAPDGEIIEITIGDVSAILDPKPMFIADGHHRYETACNYRDWLAEQGPLDPNHPANFVLTQCVSMNVG